MRWGHAGILSFALLLVTMHARGDMSECDECATGKFEEQVINGHLFQYPLFAPSPFVTTHFGVQTGLERIHVSNFPISPNATADVNAFSVSEHVEFGIRLFKRFQISGFGDADAFSGMTVRSIIVGGAGFSYRGGGALAARLFRAKNTQMAINLGFGAGNARKAQLLTLVQSLIDSPDATVTSVIQGDIGEVVVNRANVFTETLSLALAQTISPTFGFQASAGLFHSNMDLNFFDNALGERRETSPTLWTTAFDVHFGADFLPHFGLPLAIVGEYALRFTHVTGGWLDPSNNMAVGLFYTARAELQLGLSALYRFRFSSVQGIAPDARPYPAGDPTDKALVLSLRYTW